MLFKRLMRWLDDFSIGFKIGAQASYDAVQEAQKVVENMKKREARRIFLLLENEGITNMPYSEVDGFRYDELFPELRGEDEK